MRPTALSMCAFGSYAGHVALDMDALGREGLYLICGDTGAGKSTIFDAISYALYGSASGGMRKDGELLRSEVAKPGEKSWVEMTFEHAGARYTILRTMRYERKAARGGGMTLKEADACLTLPDGRVIEGRRRVNEQIEELLRIKYEHFSRIMMIAQGEFNQLLMADTEARGRILQKICDTSRHRAAQAEFAARAKALEEERAPLAERVRSAFAYAACGPDSGERALLDALRDQPSPYRAREFLDCLSRIALEDSAAQSALRDQQADMNARRAALERAAAAHEAARTARKARRDADARLSALRAALPEIERLYEAQCALDAPMQSRAARLSLLKAQIAAYDELDADVRALSQKRRDAQAARERARALALEEEALNQAQEKDDLEAGTLKDAPVLCEQALSRGREIEAQGRAASRAAQVLERLMRGQEDLAVQQKALAAAAEKARLDALHCATMRRDLLLSQAGLMAQRLMPGEPCPVCGATAHPNPAKRPKSSLGEEEVERAEAAHALTDRAARELGERVRQCLGGVCVLRVQAEEALRECAPEEAEKALKTDQSLEIVTRRRALLRQAYARAREDAAAHKARVERLSALEGARAGRTARRAEISPALRAQEAQGSALDVACAQIEERIKARRAALPCPSRSQADEIIQREQEAYDGWRAALQACRRDVDACRAEFAANERQIALLDEQLQNQTKVLSEPEEQTLVFGMESIGAALQENARALHEIAARAHANALSHRAVNDALKQFEALDALSAVAKDLADAANGRLRGADKLTFERYAQIAYFERVLRMANQRFLQMTGGQYLLERAEEAEDQRSQYGLELNVFNQFTGKRRPVRTLSGGESFMASLSLALGFADAIRQEAGGVAMDVLFIDEGFGALDETALDQVLGALTRLSGGGKLIGIISHVAQLRTRIERQIVVTKDRTGSTAKLL